MANFGLSDHTLNGLRNLFAQFPEIEQVLIYGSRAKGNYREGSDIDLTFKGKQLTSDLLTKIALHIDDLDTPYLFDLSLFDQLHSEALITQIHQTSQVFYQKA